MGAVWRMRRRGGQESVLRGVVLALVLVLAGCCFLAGYLWECDTQVQQRNTADSSVGKLKTMQWENQTFVEKTDITTLLVMGIDLREGDRRFSAQDGGQADFLQLLVLDGQARTVHRLAIDRDTMTEVEVTSLFGQTSSTSILQICLSHGYGQTDKENNENAVRAVSNLLDGLQIDGYISFNLKDIGRLNDLLGGVTVTLEDDTLAEKDPRMVKGATLKLTAEQAEHLVHDRMDVGDGTNTGRMRRQAGFLKGLEPILRDKLKDNASAEALYLDMESLVTTNLSRGALINMAVRAAKWKAEAPRTLPGEHQISAVNEVGQVDIEEFHLEKDAVKKWLAETIYMPRTL